MDPQTIERAIMRCIDISVRLGALEDEVPPAAGRVIVQCVDEIDEMQRWLEGRPRVNTPAPDPQAASPAEPHPSPRRGHNHAGGGSRRSERSTTTAPSAAP